MALHSRAGQPASFDELTNIPLLVSSYYSNKPNPNKVNEQVSFGTSGHRGSSLNNTFNDVHIAAICQALAEYRQQNDIHGPMFIGMDTHALSEPAFTTAIEVLVANEVTVVMQTGRDYTPTPVISHAILNYNRKQSSLADGVVITPSHNPPQDGGFKYNPPHGGPAGTDITSAIQSRANQLIGDGNIDVKRVSYSDAVSSPLVSEQDFSTNYIKELGDVIDMKAIAESGLKLGTDPLGGAGLGYWDKIAKHYALNIEVVNTRVDPQFSFMRLDKDGKIRMDCSSPYAMAGLIELKDKFDLAFGNDPDFDRHGIVCKSGGLMNPNHYLAVAINYLYQHRPQWNSDLAIGKTLVSSSMIDRVAKSLGRQVAEMPVGFKWFVDGLLDGNIGFAGEESAGGIFLRRDGTPWATDKDGFILCLLAAEITAKTGMDPAQHYTALTEQYGSPVYKRIDVAATPEQKSLLSAMDKNVVDSDTLAGDMITHIVTHASGNGAAIGGVKISTDRGWFAARPSGTENVYKIYAESFVDSSHLELLLKEAESLVAQVLKIG
jgi:phosphoglucomutase